MSSAGNIIFGNLPLIFAVGVAIGMARDAYEWFTVTPRMTSKKTLRAFRSCVQ